MKEASALQKLLTFIDKQLLLTVFNTTKLVEPLVAPQRCATENVYHGERAIFYVNLIQLKEFP